MDCRLHGSNPNLGPLTSAYAAGRISSNPMGSTKQFGWLQAAADLGANDV